MWGAMRQDDATLPRRRGSRLEGDPRRVGWRGSWTWARRSRRGGSRPLRGAPGYRPSIQRDPPRSGRGWSRTGHRRSQPQGRRRRARRWGRCSPTRSLQLREGPAERGGRVTGPGEDGPIAHLRRVVRVERDAATLLTQMIGPPVGHHEEGRLGAGAQCWQQRLSSRLGADESISRQVAMHNGQIGGGGPIIGRNKHDHADLRWALRLRMSRDTRRRSAAYWRPSFEPSSTRARSSAAV